MSISSVVVVIYLVAVTEVKAKWLPILEFLDEGLTIPSLVFSPSICSLQLSKCHFCGHNLHGGRGRREEGDSVEEATEEKQAGGC